MGSQELANKIFDSLSDGYDDEEEREMTVHVLYNELKDLREDSFIMTSLKALCERVERNLS